MANKTILDLDSVDLSRMTLEDERKLAFMLQNPKDVQVRGLKITLADILKRISPEDFVEAWSPKTLTTTSEVLTKVGAVTVKALLDKLTGDNLVANFPLTTSPNGTDEVIFKGKRIKLSDLLADNLATDSSVKALTAKQGKALQNNKANKSDVYTTGQVDTKLNTKFDKTSVKQETGPSTSNTMSQKAITDALEKKAQHSIGETWITIDGSVPIGGEPYLGQKVSKAKYPDLWNLVKGKAVKDPEWQAEASKRDGDYHKFADVDSTWFRMPRITHWLKGGVKDENDTVRWLTESLPNSKGSAQYDYMGYTGYSNASFEGVFGANKGAKPVQGTTAGGKPGGQDWGYPLTFDASKSNSVYKDNAHVQPMSNVILIGCYAFGEAINVGQMDASKLANDISTIQSGAYEFPSLKAKEVISPKLTVGSGSWEAGWTLLPNGLMLQWGQSAVRQAGGAGWEHIPFKKNFAEKPLVVGYIGTNYLNAAEAMGFIRYTTLNEKGFDVSLFYLQMYYWIAIGKATV